MPSVTGKRPERIIGVIADTHGLVRPAALKALAGSELILHAGDIGKPSVLDSLRTIAPVVAVRGNVDTGDWASTLRVSEVVEIGRHRIYVVHTLHELEFSAVLSGLDAVVSGHSHQPSIGWRGDVLFLNPGSAGPKRFKLPISVAILTISGKKLEARLIELPV